MILRSSVKNKEVASQDICRAFLESNGDSQAYEDLFYLFLDRFLRHLHPQTATTSFPGYPSTNGCYQDGIEGFTRFLPLISAWLSSGRQSTIDTANGSTLDLEDLVRRALRRALDPTSKGYYGRISNYDHRVIAAALISLSLWLLRESLWDRMGAREQEMVSDWLNQVNTVKVNDNNWHLFVVMVNAVLKHFGCPYSPEQYVWHYNRHKSFYLGDGWYRDGPEGIVDYYNAWEVHPFLIWIDQMDAELDSAFIRRTTRQFLKSFIFFFTPEGFPIFGRSICYRLALPTAFILAEALGWSSMNAGTARSALNAIWYHFVKYGAIRKGSITQGYYGECLDFLDNYSGPGSCNWSLLSLVAALAQSSESGFWTRPPVPLPIENQSYEVFLPAAGMVVRGDSRTQKVKVRLQTNEPSPYTQDLLSVSRFSLFQKMIVRLLSNLGLFDYVLSPKMPYRFRRFLTRPNNWEVKYKLHEYHSDRPRCMIHRSSEGH